MAARTDFTELENTNEFIERHNGSTQTQISEMLATLKIKSVEELMTQTVPAKIRCHKSLDLSSGATESEMLSYAKKLASQNQVFKSMIGMGYYGTHTPTVILRNILENPGWYTAYTPYQAEISQGRMEALLNFQTMIMDLTAMPIANASLLDEGTAAAEAMAMCHSISKKKNANKILVAQDCLPQTIEVLQTRAEPLGIQIEIARHEDFQLTDDVFAVLVQYPGVNGDVCDFTSLAKKAQSTQTLVIAAADLLALTQLKPPGEWGADVVVGSAQRFGVPMGFGGPHAGFFAAKDEHKRSIPGRLIGVSIDSHGKPALRLALQTREQHIRREKATSNICTSQVLLAVMASMYAVYHGPKGLQRIAQRTQRLMATFAKGLEAGGVQVLQKNFFDTITVQTSNRAAVIQKLAAEKINARIVHGEQIGFSFDETTRPEDVEKLWAAFSVKAVFGDVEKNTTTTWPEALNRTSSYLQHPVFNSYHSETEMLRYLHRLQAKDLSLTFSMIPLGSCTMKLNATSEMIPVTWPEFSALHPFAPIAQAQGSVRLIRELEGMLCEITGFAGVSVQPNAGSQGEYAGLMVIRKYHQTRGEGHRNICLIPSSAHGTNPASAVMAGMQVVVTKCDSQGNVDIADLKEKALLHSNNLAALMITYPSTHGVFEEGITEICQIVHQNGGQVYMDGANFNALVGYCRPGDFGPDVCHLNLHKTFCIPHGGGGPGVGPIGVASHLKNFLPKHSLVSEAGPATGTSSVTSAPWGSASILPISWAYITMMGRDGLKQATELAILNANYIAARLAPHYPILYKGQNGRVAHECIIDLRDLKTQSGIEVEDVAKRLMDYGFHSPTMSWPVVGTLMIEPTESESKAELDRFCEAMISIREEIRAVETGKMDRDINPLKKAPHTASDVLREVWDRPYTREQAAFPLEWVRTNKFWPSVGRVNNAHGDRNLVCACLPIESYQ